MAIRIGKYIIGVRNGDQSKGVGAGNVYAKLFERESGAAGGRVMFAAGEESPATGP